jgi:hypothetical protein
MALCVEETACTVASRCPQAGIFSFVGLPLGAHLYTLITVGAEHPNFVIGLIGCSLQLVGVVLFLLFNLLSTLGCLNAVLAGKFAFIGEILTVFFCFLAYLQWEFFATAGCAGVSILFHNLLIVAAVLPFAFCARSLMCSESAFPSAPSLLLVDAGGHPLARTGPAPVMQYNRDGARIPDVDLQVFEV